MNIQDPWPAYCLDNSIATFGNALENAIEIAGSEAKNDKEANRKRQRTLDKWLGIPARYRNPMGPSKS